MTPEELDDRDLVVGWITFAVLFGAAVLGYVAGRRSA